MRGSSEPSYAMFVKRTRPEDKGNDFRFHPHNPENTHYLLELMGVYTENDRILLGKLTETLPECTFLNKRGTMLSPTIVSDMGILNCSDRVWYLVVAGTPSIDSTATFEDIQASIESFATAFADFVK